MVLSSKQVYVDVLDSSPFQELLKNGRIETSKQKEQMAAVKCPRCYSINTKFCYYNNYSRSQPRYLCKSCKRHWTEGGTFRDVPVGGGRKAKRPAKASSASSTGATSAANMCQQLYLPFLDGQENSIFPDAPRSVLHTGDLVNNNGFLGSPFSSSLSYDPLPGIFKPITSTGACDSVSIYPSPIYCSSSGSSLQDQMFSGTLESHEQLQTTAEMPSSSDALNILETTPSVHWNFWDVDIMGLAPPHP